MRILHLLHRYLPMWPFHKFKLLLLFNPKQKFRFLWFFGLWGGLCGGLLGFWGGLLGFLGGLLGFWGGLFGLCGGLWGLWGLFGPCGLFGLFGLAGLFGLFGPAGPEGFWPHRLLPYENNRSPPNEERENRIASFIRHFIRSKILFRCLRWVTLLRKPPL